MKHRPRSGIEAHRSGSTLAPHLRMPRRAGGRDPGVIDSRSLEFPHNHVSRSIDADRGVRQPRPAPVCDDLARPASSLPRRRARRSRDGRARSSARRHQSIGPCRRRTFAPSSERDKKELGDHRLGSGPVLSRGALISPVAFNLLRATAERIRVPYTVHAVGRDTATNADAIHIAREGVATALVSIPNRYMHSPNEMVSLDDVDHVAELIAETCRAVTGTTDFTAR